MYTHWRLPVKLDLMLHIGQKAHEPDITLHTLRYKVKKKMQPSRAFHYE